MTAKTAEQRIADGSSWSDFCDALERAGEVILREGSPRDPFDRAEGFRYLSAADPRRPRVASSSSPTPLCPVLRRPAHETVKIGRRQPGQLLPERRRSQRRVRVPDPGPSAGTIHYLGFGTYAGGYGSSGRIGPDGYRRRRRISRSRPTGSFELVLSSCDERPGNWLPMEPDSSLLIVRQTFRGPEERAHRRPLDRAPGRRGPAASAAHCPSSSTRAWRPRPAT